MILVIDDLRTLRLDGNPLVHVRDSVRALERLQLAARRGEVIEQLWLDHDLGGDDDIRPVVRWLEEQAALETGELPEIRAVFLHSSNPVGVAWMKAALRPWFRVQVVSARQYLDRNRAL